MPPPTTITSGEKRCRRLVKPMPSQRASSSRSASASGSCAPRLDHLAAGHLRARRSRRSAEPSPGAGRAVARRPSAVPEATASKQPIGAAEAGRARAGDGHVADLGGEAAAAVQDVAVDHHPAADAGRDGDEDQRLRARAPPRSATRRGRRRWRRSRAGPAGPSLSRRMAASGTSLQPERVGGAMTMPATGSSGPGAQTPTPAAACAGRGGAHLGRERLDLRHDRVRPAAGERRRGREGEEPAARRPPGRRAARSRRGRWRARPRSSRRGVQRVQPADAAGEVRRRRRRASRAPRSRRRPPAAAARSRGGCRRRPRA